MALAFSACALAWPLAVYASAGHASKPLNVKTLPSVIPHRGVNLADMILGPAKASAAGMSEAQVVALARRKHWMIPGKLRATLVVLSVPGTFDNPANSPFDPPIRKKLAWVLFTKLAKPVPLPGMTVHYGHYQLTAVDAVTGKFLIGTMY